MSETNTSTTVKPDILDVKTGYDEPTGLRTVELTIRAGFPEKYIGKYMFREWSYGEKIRVELEVEKEFPAKEPDMILKGERMIGKEVKVTLRSSPIPIDDIFTLPGRLGTILANVTGYVNVTPDEEKKS